MDITFKPYDKIHRLKRDIIITEKIDGTNAQIYVPEDPNAPLLAGSRNRWITPEDDNYGFARWVQEKNETLRLLGPGRHYGEWFGSGIQRRYGLDHKRFCLFNAARFDILDAAARLRLAEVHVYRVPVLYSGLYSDSAIDTTMAVLRNNGSVAAPGFMDPEGIVIYHVASRYFFKQTFDDGHKTQGGKAI